MTLLQNKITTETSFTTFAPTHLRLHHISIGGTDGSFSEHCSSVTLRTPCGQKESLAVFVLFGGWYHCTLRSGDSFIKGHSINTMNTCWWWKSWFTAETCPWCACQGSVSHVIMTDNLTAEDNPSRLKVTSQSNGHRWAQQQPGSFLLCVCAGWFRLWLDPF